MNRERFVRFEGRVAIDQHGHLHRGIGWPEGQRRRRNRGEVARSYRCPVHRLVIDGRTQRRAAGLRHRKDKGSCARITFSLRHIINREGRRGIIVRDRARAGVCRDGRVVRIAERDGKGLTAFINAIVDDRDRDRGREVASRDRARRIGCGRVIARSYRRPVRS